MVRARTVIMARNNCSLPQAQRVRAQALDLKSLNPVNIPLRGKLLSLHFTDAEMEVQSYDLNVLEEALNPECLSILSAPIKWCSSKRNCFGGSSKVGTMNIKHFCLCKLCTIVLRKEVHSTKPMHQFSFSRDLQLLWQEEASLGKPVHTSRPLPGEWRGQNEEGQTC